MLIYTGHVIYPTDFQMFNVHQDKMNIYRNLQGQLSIDIEFNVFDSEFMSMFMHFFVIQTECVR